MGHLINEAAYHHADCHLNAAGPIDNEIEAKQQQ